MKGGDDLDRRSCVRCGTVFPNSSRADRVTCSTRCRVAAWRAQTKGGLPAGEARAEEQMQLPRGPAAVVKTPYLGSPEVATPLSLWLADVAAEAAARDHAA